jgi:tRNA pseudouridine synthase 10
MNILNEAREMLEQKPLCDHCLGRQFALLGYGLENDERGKALKLALLFEAQEEAESGSAEGIRRIKLLASHGFFVPAIQVLQKMRKRLPKNSGSESCFLCQDRFKQVNALADAAVRKLENYDLTTFLVGVELPAKFEEREDEFKSVYTVKYGESLRNEFGRLIGKRVAELAVKDVDHLRPEIVILTDPFAGQVRLQINPLYVSGRYRKLVRDIPQSKWFCSACHGKGCPRCGGTGKMYAESVEEIIEQPFLKASGSSKASFHAAGREDIDARMLGTGRPFVVEIDEPKKRFLDLRVLEKAVNAQGKGKVSVSNLAFADKVTVRKLKKGEMSQKEYSVLIEFAERVSEKQLRLLEKTLQNSMICQQTPNRVLHRRADLVREKYIYDVKVKKLSHKKVEMRIRCQGGLYVKELVTGDEGRTTPNVSQILGNKAKPLKLDVLSVIMED